MARRRQPGPLLALALVALGGGCAEGPAPPGRLRVGVPPEVLDPPWLDGRRREQVEAVAGTGLRHDFSFADHRQHSGISFRHRAVDDAGESWLPVHYDHGNGVAAADVDGDGGVDLYFTQQVGGNEMWRHVGDGRFDEITPRAGVAVDDAISVAASFADVDNDGAPDLFVTTVRKGNRLFHNDGAGRFRDVAAAVGVDYAGHSSAAVFFDYNLDGRLDLFLCNVGVYTADDSIAASRYSWDADPRRYHYYRGLTEAFGGHLQPERHEASRLYESGGDEAITYRDVTDRRGLHSLSWTGDATPVDANADGWPDLYVLDMQGHDEYFENVEGRRFVDRSRLRFPRTPWGSMGVKAFDVDNDARQDLFVTDMHSDMSVDVGPAQEKVKARIEYGEAFLRSGGRSLYGNALFRQRPDGRFEESSDRAGAETYWPWGLSVGDVNADGFLDAVVTGSMNYPFRYGINSVLLNDRGRRFVDSEFALGVEPRREGRTARPWFELDCGGVDATHADCEGHDGPVEIWGALGTRASILLDIDDDGDLDIVTNDFHAEPMVLVSDLAQRLGDQLRYLRVELVGTGSNRDGLGARVLVSAGRDTFLQVQDGKSGYLSQSRMPLYFGLGDHRSVDRVEITWPSGRRQALDGPLATNRHLRLVEPAE